MAEVQIQIPFKAYEGDEPYVFVSYAHVDKAHIFPLIGQLHAKGYRIWYDEGIDPGTEFSDNIAKHLKRACSMLLFVTPRSIARAFVKDEIHYALNANIPIIPVFLEETELTDGLDLRLSRYQWIHYYLWPNEEAFFEELVRSPYLNGAVEVPQQLQPQYQYEQPYEQPYDPYAYAEPIPNKKSNLPLILAIIGVLLIGIAALLIFVIIPTLAPAKTDDDDNNITPTLDQTQNTQNPTTIEQTVPTTIELEDDNFGLFLNKSDYAPGEQIILNVSGNVSAQMLREHAFIVLSYAGDSHGSGFDYINLEKNITQYTAYAPTEPGAYEVRLYENASGSDMSFLASVSFEVVDVVG